MKMTSGAETAAGAAAIKYFGVPAIAAAFGTGLGFAVLWPKTAKEAAVRFAVSIMSSIVFGPVAVVYVYSRSPELFASAEALARKQGMPEGYGMLLVSAPLLVLTALVAWWPLGWLVRWMEKRKDKDLGEIVQDVRQEVAGR